MCAQRMLRKTGPWSEAIRSGKVPRPHPRQQTLDLEASDDRPNFDIVAAQAQSLRGSLTTWRVSWRTLWTILTPPGRMPILPWWRKRRTN